MLTKCFLGLLKVADLGTVHNTRLYARCIHFTLWPSIVSLHLLLVLHGLVLGLYCSL